MTEKLQDGTCAYCGSVLDPEGDCPDDQCEYWTDTIDEEEEESGLDEQIDLVMEEEEKEKQ